LHSTNITGILDKQTNKIYHISIFSLLHLGAYSVNILPKCKILEKEKSLILPSKKIMVLGLNAPSLFFTSLVQLEDEKNDSKHNKKE
jgi:hypothetical protein